MMSFTTLVSIRIKCVFCVIIHPLLPFGTVVGRRRLDVTQVFRNGSDTAMSSKTESKKAELLKLAKRRQETPCEGYYCIGDFHGGIYECDHVSPITKSGGCVDADIMVVLQDWSGADYLNNIEKSQAEYEAEKGCDPKSRTNKKLDELLNRHFGLKRADCYLTNLFPFIKGGEMSADISCFDLVYCARTFTLKEIKIVDPKMVICLGLNTFLALRSAAGHVGNLKLADAIDNPFCLERLNASVYCVAHSGGNRTRNREQNEKDWETLKKTYDLKCKKL